MHTVGQDVESNDDPLAGNGHRNRLALVANGWTGPATNTK